MSAERIVSFEERHAQQKGKHAAAARHATALWTTFMADGTVHEAEGEHEHGGMQTRILLVVLSVLGSSCAMTAWLTVGWLYGLGLYLVTLVAIGVVLWRCVRKPASP